jgi:hypothetical protein
LWNSPDPHHQEVGASGEMLIARIRLLLTSILLLIPLISLWYEQETWENLVGLAVTLTAFLVALPHLLVGHSIRQSDLTARIALQFTSP